MSSPLPLFTSLYLSSCWSTMSPYLTLSNLILLIKETPTCLVIFLILRKLKTKPNGPLGSSTQAELTIVSTSQTKHLIL